MKALEFVDKDEVFKRVTDITYKLTRLRCDEEMSNDAHYKIIEVENMLLDLKFYIQDYNQYAESKYESAIEDLICDLDTVGDYGMILRSKTSELIKKLEEVSK